jgi:tRNA G37 N-methylase TrmD
MEAVPEAFRSGENRDAAKWRSERHEQEREFLRPDFVGGEEGGVALDRAGEAESP